ncbi:hypothetical protein Ancab_014662, partial [Ancistrocladus abbreviatus]
AMATTTVVMIAVVMVTMKTIVAIWTMAVKTDDDSNCWGDGNNDGYRDGIS